ncbi:MAG: hypothetical protein ABEJ69_02615 [Candidatus Nanohaloarchaea archaeon]
MEKRKLALSLLFLAVLISGCTDGGGTKSTDGKTLAVTGPTITPTTVPEGASTSVRLGLKNVGELNATLVLDNDAASLEATKAQRVFTNYCSDFFNITSFTPRTPAERVSDLPAVKLRPGQEIQMTWQLKQSGGRVPLNGYDCQMSFRAPFNYTVEAFRQIQVKKSAEGGGEPSLYSKSSKGPMKIEIETIGSSSERGSPVFLEGDNIEILLQFRNKKPDEELYTGVIDLKNPKIEVSGGENVAEIDCNGDGDYHTTESKIGGIHLYEGQKSRIIRCDLRYMNGDSMDVPSKIIEISATADYNYIKDIGSRSVKVKYGGN